MGKSKNSCITTTYNIAYRAACKERLYIPKAQLGRGLR
jgi:hypothetical protein